MAEAQPLTCRLEAILQDARRRGVRQVNDPRLEAMGDTPGSDVCGCTRVMLTEWHRCEKCGLSAEQRIETVDGRGLGFKCENCRWWNWIVAA